MSETYPGQMLPELQEKTTVDSNDLFYMVSSNASKKIKGSNLKDQMKPSDYTGATSSTNGANGLVPQPTTSDVDRFLKGDGTWGDISYAVGEASGSIASFSDGSPLPMHSLKAYIEPVQDLHGYDSPWVGGAGKNKFDQDSITEISSTAENRRNGQVFEGVGTFTVSASSNISSGNIIYSRLYSNGTYGTVTSIATDNSHTSQTYTLASGDKIIIFDASQHTIAESKTVFSQAKVQLESGSTATAFAPYSNECPIIGWDEVNVTRCGKNLWTGTHGVITSCIIPKNTQFCVSTDKGSGTSQFHVYDENKNRIDYWNIDLIDGDRYYKTFTLNKDVYYVMFGSTVNTNYQINFGTDKEYTEKGLVYDITFQDGSTPLTVYGGKVDLVSGVMTVDRVSVDLGTLNYSAYGGTSSYDRYISSSIDSVAKANGLCVSDIYTFKGTQTMSANQIWVGGGNSKLSITTNVGAYNDVSAFKTGMSGHQLIYELATPLTYQLTPTQVNSLLGVNNVWADTGDVDVHYVRDLTITIDDILSRLEALEG